MLIEADELVELFKGYLPYYLLIVLPIFIIISPVCPVGAAHEFPVYRMQQYDLHGIPHGCRSAAVSLEARSVSGWGTSRHCVVARLEELTVDRFREIRARAGALLIVLPRDLPARPDQEKQQILELEETMLSQDVNIPVYFLQWSPNLQQILEDVDTSFVTDDHAGSAAEALLNSVSANGYQIVVGTNQPTARTDVNVVTLQGKLPGYGVEEKLPTIALVAHYDSFGVAPELAMGADSNGSGVAMLMELARLFSQLYSSSKTHARHNIVFVLSAMGKLNYLGSKKWLEDQLDGGDGGLIQDASFVLCLDTLASSDGLYLHVSKPPKEGSPGAHFLKELKSVSETMAPSVAVEGVHKKINLAEEVLAWEHERYSIRRLPAFTLSSLKTHRDMKRATIQDLVETVDIDLLARNTHILVESLARHIYNLSAVHIFRSDYLDVEKDSLQSWVELLSSQPRSAQLLVDKHNYLLNTLKTGMNRYLKEVKASYLTPDKRDPEFVFYDVTKALVNVYSVKPAVFDLFLTIVIVLYLGLVYLFIQNFPSMYLMVSRFASGNKSKVY